MALAAANGSKGSTAGATSIATAAVNTSVSGSGFAVFVANSNTATVTNIQSNKETITLASWTLVDISQNDSTDGFRAALYILPKGVGGTGHQFTVTISGSTAVTATAIEITTTSGQGITYDTGLSAIDSASPFTNPSFSNTKPVSLMISALSGNSASNPATHAESTGYTIVTGAEETNGASFWNAVIGTKGVTSSAAQVASWTETGGTRAIVVTAAVYEVTSNSGWRRSNASGPGKHPGPRKFAPLARGYTTTVSPDVTIALTGSAVNFSTGALTPSTDVALSGSQYSWATGTLAPSTTVGLSGQAYGWSAGTVTPSSALALTGSLESYSAGNLAPSTTVVLTGTQYNWSTGTITASTGGDVTVALSGSLINYSTGTLAPSNTVALTGSSEAYFTGTLGVNHSQAITGVSEAYSAGVLTPATTITLLGQLYLYSTGSMTAQAGGDVTVALTGIQYNYFAGQMQALGGDLGSTSGGLHKPYPRPYLPNQTRGETEEEKRKRRIEQGIIQEEKPVVDRTAEIRSLERRLNEVQEAAIRFRGREQAAERREASRSRTQQIENARKQLAKSVAAQRALEMELAQIRQAMEEQAARDAEERDIIAILSVLSELADD